MGGFLSRPLSSFLGPSKRGARSCNFPKYVSYIDLAEEPKNDSSDPESDETSLSLLSDESSSEALLLWRDSLVSSSSRSLPHCATFADSFIFIKSQTLRGYFILLFVADKSPSAEVEYSSSRSWNAIEPPFGTVSADLCCKWEGDWTWKSDVYHFHILLTLPLWKLASVPSAPKTAPHSRGDGTRAAFTGSTSSTSEIDFVCCTSNTFSSFETICSGRFWSLLNSSSRSNCIIPPSTVPKSPIVALFPLYKSASDLPRFLPNLALIVVVAAFVSVSVSSPNTFAEVSGSARIPTWW